MKAAHSFVGKILPLIIGTSYYTMYDKWYNVYLFKIKLFCDYPAKNKNKIELYKIDWKTLCELYYFENKQNNKLMIIRIKNAYTHLQCGFVYLLWYIFLETALVITWHILMYFCYIVKNNKLYSFLIKSCILQGRFSAQYIN